MLCYITCVMLCYKTCVMLCYITYVIFRYITYVMLCDITSVMLCYIIYVMLFYITYVMLYNIYHVMLLYSYTFTQLNRDCHWLILGHMAWTNWWNVSRTWHIRLGKHQDSKENKTNWFPEGSDIKCVMYWPTIWPVYHMSEPNPRYTLLGIPVLSATGL